MALHKHPQRVSGGIPTEPEEKGCRGASELTQDLLGIVGKSEVQTQMHPQNILAPKEGAH